MDLLSCDIAADEERLRVFDVNAPAYPILARALIARRDNLKSPVGALEKRLSAINPPDHATADGAAILSESNADGQLQSIASAVG
ncbi:hypothetical protein [Bradyrhizobium erythrophlei]|nr:hypothetical protein [Bradyrhizobium erythrophlei]